MKGKIIALFDEVTFESGFNKREFVIETEDQYPQKIKFDTLKDDVQKLEGLAVGDVVEVEFDIQSREWEGKYFINLKAWKIAKIQTELPNTTSASPASDFPIPQTLEEQPEEDDLPF